jgi:hypothetical protein
MILALEKQSRVTLCQNKLPLVLEKDSRGGIMTKKSIAGALGLAALILFGFVIVSNFFGARRIEMRSGNPIVPPPLATVKPQASITPTNPTNRSNQVDVQLRSDLGQAESLLEQINIAVSTGDWDSAQKKSLEFERRTQRMPAPQLNHPDISPVLQDFFAFYRVHLGRAIVEQNAMEARFAVNQLFGIVNEQRARFGIRGVPVEFQRLNYLIREVAIWSQSNNDNMLRVRIDALRNAWNDVRPVIVARRHSAEQVKQFDKLVEKLSASSQSQEIAAMIPEFNKEFEGMSEVFHRAPPSAGATPGQGKMADDD